MQSTNTIGPEIRKLRKKSGETLVKLAEEIGVERAYLNKVELGSIKPSPALLNKILVHFSVEGNEAERLKQLAGHSPFSVLVQSRKEQDPVDDSKLLLPPVPNAQQISINPQMTPVLFTDSTFVNSSDYGLVLDIAQIVGGQQHNVVARIGMSFDHAKKLIEVMQDHIEKNER